jgi:thiamine-phosphate pyrophosphorylase
MQINRGRTWYTYTPQDYAIYGVAIGDALGVPAEFVPRSKLDKQPITDLASSIWHSGKEPGTWSDDTCLTLALTDSLATGKLDYADIMQRFN